MAPAALAVSILGAGAAAAIGAALFWRYVWFFRDPPRTPPAVPGIVSPADGTVVYVRRVRSGEDVVVIKQGVYCAAGGDHQGRQPGE